MNSKFSRIAKAATLANQVRYTLVATLLVIFAGSPTYAGVSQTPLYLGGGDVPGNLLLVPSVEWPTINSVASVGDYDVNKTYIGYFDPNKCYGY